MTRQKQANQAGEVLHVALELSESRWVLALTPGLGQKPRIRGIGAREVDAVEREIALARRRFGLGEAARVVVCYEAGLDGFWIQRALEARGLEVLVVDSASIEKKRGRRTAKTDRIDASALVRQLIRYLAGDRRAFSVVRVPPPEAEDLRHNDRELTRLTDERTALRNAIRGLLKTQGIRLKSLRRLPEQLEGLRCWDGQPLGPELRSRLLRLWQRSELIEQQMQEVKQRREALLQEQTPTAEKARQLLLVRSIGEETAWELATEVFGWRSFRNRRQVGGLVGLAPVPHQSGEVHREQGGIAKLGRVRLRANLIELAWLWLRYQPRSALSQWYQARFGSGGKRIRRIGIVALARRLLIELWRYLETGALPEGAVLKA